MKLRPYVFDPVQSPPSRTSAVGITVADVDLALRERDLDFCVGQRPMHADGELAQERLRVLEPGPGAQLELQRAVAESLAQGDWRRVREGLGMRRGNVAQDLEDVLGIGRVCDPDVE